jgi:hypothetical protein
MYIDGDAPPRSAFGDAGGSAPNGPPRRLEVLVRDAFACRQPLSDVALAR